MFVRALEPVTGGQLEDDARARTGGQIAPARAREPIELLPLRSLWTLALNNQLTAQPGYDATTGYFPIEQDRLVAYDLNSGGQRWIVEERPIFEPAAGEGLLFVTERGAIVARRAQDGSVAWRRPVDDEFAVRPVSDIGRIVVAARSGVVSALRGSDGELIWQRDLGSPAHAAPTLAGDRVYVPTENGRIVALKLNDGAPLWERRIGGSPNEILALTDRVYAGSTDTFFYCLMAENGRIDWRWRTGGDVIGRAAADDRFVYFLSLDNVLRSLSQKTGGQRWMRGLPLRPTTGPLLAGGTLIVTGATTTLRTFNSKDGAPATDLQAGGEIAAPARLLEQPGTGLPMLLVVTRDIVKGATVTLSVRTIDPEPAPIGALPNPITLAPMPPVRP
jgi:outer membrane protein assembly factor BamB